MVNISEYHAQVTLSERLPAAEVQTCLYRWCASHMYHPPWMVLEISSGIPHLDPFRNIPGKVLTFFASTIMFRRLKWINITILYILYPSYMWDIPSYMGIINHQQVQLGESQLDPMILPRLVAAAPAPSSWHLPVQKWAESSRPHREKTRSSGNTCLHKGESLILLHHALCYLLVI